MLLSRFLGDIGEMRGEAGICDILWTVEAFLNSSTGGGRAASGALFFLSNVPENPLSAFPSTDATTSADPR